MSEKDFIKKNINLLTKDNQPDFSDFAEHLDEMAEQGVGTKKVKVPADGNWFKLSFESVEIKENRLVINAERIKDGVYGEQYIVEFKGTRAAYLRGYYESSHRVGRWPYIHWDIRSYMNHPIDKNKRVCVAGFYADQELEKMIKRMESLFGTKNIVNTYINDNLMRLQTGFRAGKSLEEIESDRTANMLRKLGYQYVEAVDTGPKKGAWQGAKVHWYKLQQDKLS